METRKFYQWARVVRTLLSVPVEVTLCSRASATKMSHRGAQAVELFIMGDNLGLIRGDLICDQPDDVAPFTSVCPLLYATNERHLSRLDSGIRDFTSCAIHRVRPRLFQKPRIGMATTQESAAEQGLHDDGTRFPRGSARTLLVKGEAT
jgi:hypothetical protein